MRSPQEIIAEIKDKFSPERNEKEVLLNILSACDVVGGKLYGAKEHFLFELIQNADDNSYAAGVAPSLDISIEDIEIAGKKQTCLILKNNEIGFSEDNVRALCRIGQSTKKKTDGFIGEKGIGFKSVFAVTERPYIFSNGFQFSLPKTIMLGNTKLGYIVPVWEDIAPIEITKNTTIILPLNDPQNVIEKIQVIEPQTLLFLHKLSSMTIHINWNGICSERIIECKSISERSVSERIVRLESLAEIDGLSEHSSVEYFCNTIAIDVPDDLTEGEREGIKSRELTIALPLTRDENFRGGVFAYLPIQDGTVLPFLLNCDFLLTSSREKILENDWNRWIRDRIAPFFTDIIEKTMADSNLTVECKQLIFSCIPITTGNSFLEPLAGKICEILKNRKCLLTEGSYLPISPDHCYRAPEEVRRILKRLDWVAAEDRDGDFMLAESFEQCDEILKKLGMQTCTCQQVVDLVSDDLIAKLSNEQLCSYYLFLIENANDHVVDAEHSLLPIDNGGLRIMQKSTPDRFICFPKETDICIQDFPQLKISFLDNEFYSYLNQSEANESLLNFMKESLQVHDYKTDDYCRKLRDLLNEFEGSEDDFIKISHYIIDNDVFPETLFTDKGFVSRKEKQIVVSPEYNPQNGWQYIWTHDSEQQHFAFCQKYPRDAEQKLVEKGIISLFPPFNIIECNSFDLKQGLCSDEARNILETLNFSPSRQDRTVWYPAMPATIEKDLPETAMAALVNMFSHITAPIDKDDVKHTCGLFVKVKYCPKGQRWRTTHFIPSSLLEKLKTKSWLPTTKGYQQPSMTWCPSEEIKNLWEDNVPYITDNIPYELLGEFGVHTSITTSDILEYLLCCSEQQKVMEIEFASKIYSNLSVRSMTDQDIESLKNNNCIYIPEGNKWVSPSQCLWEKSSAFKEQFFYLSTIYQGLKKFFVEKIGVQEKADCETYLKLWEECENTEKIFNNQDVEEIYKNLIKFKNHSDIKEKWQRFCECRTKLLSRDGKFEEKNIFVFSDSSLFEDLFRDSINIVYIPPDGKNDEWKDFYHDFGVPALTESISIKISDDDFVHDELSDCTEDYLTSECVVMVSTWIFQNDSSSYTSNLALIEKLKDVRIFNVGRDIPVQYTLKLHDKIYEKDTLSKVFWDDRKNIIYCNTNSDDIDGELAYHIAQKVVSTTAVQLSDSIEHYFGETTLRRIERQKWNIPDEFKVWYEKGANQLQDNERGDEIEAISTKIDQKGEYAINCMGAEEKIKIQVENPDYAAEIVNAFNRADNSKEENIEKNHDDEANGLSDVAKARRYDKQREHIATMQHEEVVAQKDLSRAPKDDIMTSLRLSRSSEKKVRKLFEALDPDMKVRIFYPVDPQVRTFLEQEYSGKCQVCGQTFPMTNGHPHFIALYLIPRSKGGLPHNGNAICLCAEHFAQWQNATKHLPDLRQAVKDASWADHPQIKFELAKQQVALTYTQRHFIDFKAILGEMNE